MKEASGARRSKWLPHGFRARGIGAKKAIINAYSEMKMDIIFCKTADFFISFIHLESTRYALDIYVPVCFNCHGCNFTNVSVQKVVLPSWNSSYISFHSVRSHTPGIDHCPL